MEAHKYCWKCYLANADWSPDDACDHETEESAQQREDHLTELRECEWFESRIDNYR